MADNTLIININGSAKDFLDEVDKVKKESKELEKVLGKVAKASAVAFAGFASAIAIVTKSFADYQTALVGVGKTTNLAGDDLDRFGKEIQKLSSEIPVATNELLGITQAAAQLGVKGEDNLLKFTSTVAKLGVATDLTGEQAATSLTRILNVTGETVGTIDTLGSVVVALGNTFAATESEIVRVTTEVARGTAVFGVSAAEATALGAALKSVGVQAQLGGSAVGRAFREIDSAIRDGGVAFENLQNITGLTGDKLKKTFETDSTQVFQKFIEGLGDIQKANGSTEDALASLNLKGDEINKVLPVLAKNSELVAKALGTAAKETQNATALNEEAARAFDTLSSEAQLVRNNFTTLTTNIGAALAPAVEELLKSVNGLLNEFNNLDEETIGTIASFLKWGAAITASVTTVSTFAIGLLKARQILRGLKIAFGIGRIAAIGFTTALTGGLSLILTFLPEIIEGVKTLIGLINKKEEPKTLQDINSEIEKLIQKQDELNRRGLRGDQARVAELQKQIEKLKELRDAKIKASEDFGTGELLVRPVADGGVPDFGQNAFQQQEIPLSPNADKAKEARKKDTEDLQANEQKKKEIIDEGARNRLEAAQRLNDELREIRAARLRGASEAELEEIQERQKFDAERAAALKIRDDNERRLTLQNIDIRQKEAAAARAKGQQDRINEIKQQTSDLAALQKARDDGASESEIEALETRQRFREEYAAAEKIRAKEERDATIANIRQREQEALDAIADANELRVAQAQRQIDNLKAIRQARYDGATEEEIEFLQRRQEIEDEFATARAIKNQERREQELERLQLKHEQELEQIEEFEALKNERAAEREEQRRELEEELRELDVEQREQIDEEDRAALEKKVLTDKQIKKKAALDEANERIKARNKFKEDELKFGTTIAKLRQFFNSQQVQGVKDTSQQLTQLTRSRNSTLKSIGKSAARVNAAIATAEGAIKAYTALSGIPIVGPVLGAAAAAALIAFGVEQQNEISRAQTGGFVPPTSASGGARDRVPTLLEPGELVVPRAIAPNFIQAAGIPDTQAAEGGDLGDDDGTPTIEIMLEDRAGEFISLEQREGRSLGVIGDQ